MLRKCIYCSHETIFRGHCRPCAKRAKAVNIKFKIYCKTNGFEGLDSVNGQLREELIAFWIFDKEPEEFKRVTCGSK